MTEDEILRIKTTLSVIFREQGDQEISQLLDEARADAEQTGHDNWDGGIDFFALRLWISPQRFAAMEDRLEPLEKRIESKFARLNVDNGSERLTDVRIVVDHVSTPTAVRLPFPTPTDEARIWEAGKLRLFISHVSRIKPSAGRLKAALGPLGVDAFVAHEDIEPTLEWAREIELALRSMHALCALVTEDFHHSLWCDQEVGFALGRPVPVVPIRVGADPYGLMGKSQAITAADNAEALADRTFLVLMKLESCRAYLTDGLVTALESAYTYANAKVTMKRLTELTKYLSEPQVKRLLAAMTSNSQVNEATGVPEQIEAIARFAKVPVTDALDDDIPF